MRIINKSLLAEFAKPGRCERCGKLCVLREAHHVFTRGSGRLDIRINLVSLGSTRLMQCRCHRHAAKIGRGVFLEIVAKREGVSVEWIVAEIYRLRRLPQPRNGERELALRKRPKRRSAWATKAGELRRARNRALYRWLKDRKNSLQSKEKEHGRGIEREEHGP